MKRLISVLLVLAMVISMVPAVFAAENATSGTINAVKGTAYVTDTWTADADGVLTISVSSAEGVGYQVYCNGEALSLGYERTYGAELSYEVALGDQYYLSVKGWNPDSWTYCDATINWAYSFSADGVVKEAYTISEQVITTTGVHTVSMIETAETTIVAVTPDETGYYTISVGDSALIANCGGGEWYIHDWATLTPTTSLDWVCEEAGFWADTEVSDEFGNKEIVNLYTSGQTLMLGIQSDSETVDVTVVKTGDYSKTESVVVAYENTAELSQFQVPSNGLVGSYVNVTESHSAVLGDDGYYHLDSADGDILLVDMDYKCVLSDALYSDRPVMYAYCQDAEGNAVKYDIGNAVLAYEAVCDSNGYYPLTEDLILFYSNYAYNAGIYSYVMSDVDYNEDTAWMFACLTMSLNTELYLDPGENWPSDGAWYAVYYWDTYTTGWSAMTDTDGDGIYWALIPEGYSNVIFTRMNPASDALSWDNKWNQTVDLTVPTDGSNLFTVENPWNESYSWNATGSWSVMAVEAPEETVTGTGTEEDPYIITSLPYDLSVTYADEDAAWDGVYYQYTAEQTGVIKVADLADDYNTGTLVEPETWAMLTDGETLSVTEGEVVLLYHWGTAAQTYDLTLQYGTASEGGDTDDGDDTGDTGDGDDTVTPDSGEWSGTDVAVAADETIDIVYTPTENGVLSVAVSCETGWKINIYSEFTDEAFWSDSDESPVSCNLVAGTTYTIQIIPYDEADGWATCDAVMTYELTWTGESKENAGGSGTDEDPYILTPNADNYANVVGRPDEWACDGVYFCWEATADGTLTLTFDENDPQPYVCIWVNSLQNMVFESDNGQWTATAELTEEDYVYILIETYSFNSADYTFYASFGSEAGGGDEGGDEIVYVDLYDGDNYLFMDNTAGQVAMYYTYTATQTGTLYLTPIYLGYDYGWGIIDNTDWIESDFDPSWGTYGLTINGNTVEFYYYGSVEVNAGDEVVICWYMLDDTASYYQNYMTLNLNYEGYAFPEPGSEGDPYEVSMYEIYYGGPVATYEIPAGSTLYYELYNFSGSIVTVTGEGAYVIYNGETYTDIDGDGVVEVYADSYDMIVQIGNSGDSAAVFYINYFYPVGHVSNPQIITGNGTWTATLGENSEGYYYQWSVGDDALVGVMTITVSATDDSWSYTVDNSTQYIYGGYHYSSDDPVVSSEEWAVFAGDIFTIGVNTNYDEDYNLPAGEVTITITFEEKELVEGTDYPYYVSYYGVLPVDITVAAGAEAWVELDSFRNYNFTVTGEGAYVVYNGTTYTDDDGDGVVKVMIQDYTAAVYVGNSSDAEVTYSLNVDIPLGDYDNPQIITENGKYETSEFVEGSNNQYYFQYTATQDGTITVEVLNDTYWQINLWNKDTYASAGSNYRYAESNTFTLNVSAGNVVQIYGRTYSYDLYGNVAGTLAFNFTFEAAPEAEANTLVLGDNDVCADNTDGSLTASKYVYVAEQTGTLYLTLSGGSYTNSYGTYEVTNSSLMSNTVFTVNGEALSGNHYGTIQVTEGDEIAISWKVKYSYYKYLYEATLNLSFEGYSPVPGSEADPIELSAYDCPAETIEIAAGSTAYYSMKYFSNSYISVTGEGAYIIYNDVTYTDTDGDGVVMLLATVSPMLIQIGNSGDSTATFTVAKYYPVGSQANPEVITEGEYTGTVGENSEGYYFSFVASCDMDLTLTFSSETDYQYAIINYTTGMIWDGSDWSYWGGWNVANGEYTLTLELYQGDELSIGVNTVLDDPDDLYATSPAGSIDMSVEAVYYHVDEDGDNCCDLCGADLVSIMLGDVNGDGEVNIMDANMIVAYYNETIELTEEQLLAADVDANGEVNIMDANYIIAFYNETIDCLPAEEK